MSIEVINSKEISAELKLIRVDLNFIKTNMFDLEYNHDNGRKAQFKQSLQ